ncbi:MAG: cobalt ECF transporter T component CbiQ [Candidatus Melainabacteria bacterium GWF2_37_15]|nr:MAG: cobalt ECF transporter T component CbiQ [Candidatus Melainabacteria bacterium GWF2_37_15]
MLNIDKCAYSNNLINVHPMEKFIFVMVTIIVCLSSNSIITPILILLTVSSLTILKAGVPAKFYFKLMLIPFGFLFLGVITILIEIHTEPALSFSITQQSIETASKLFFRALGSASCLYFFSLTTPLVDFTSVLKKLKLPDILIELISLIYRLIFILVYIAGRIHTAQSSRLGYSSLKNQFRSLSQLVSSMFILSYKKANDLFISLESRCYNGNLNILEKQYCFSAKNIVFIIVIELFFILMEFNV